MHTPSAFIKLPEWQKFALAILFFVGSGFTAAQTLAQFQTKEQHAADIQRVETKIDINTRNDLAREEIAQIKRMLTRLKPLADKGDSWAISEVESLKRAQVRLETVINP